MASDGLWEIVAGPERSVCKTLRRVKTLKWTASSLDRKEENFSMKRLPDRHLQVVSLLNRLRQRIFGVDSKKCDQKKGSFVLSSSGSELSINTFASEVRDKRIVNGRNGNNCQHGKLSLAFGWHL